MKKNLCSFVCLLGVVFTAFIFSCSRTLPQHKEEVPLFKNFTAEGKKITDYPGEFYVDSIPIQVNMNQHQLNEKFGLARVCFSLRHEKTSDLKISLLSPTGTHVWLTNRNGGEEGDFYDNTCFSNDGFSGFIDAGEPPYGGEYIPDGRLSFFNDGQNPNGTWYLLVRDLAEENTGNIHYVRLGFEKNPPGDDLSMCDEDHPQYCKVAENTANGELLPDLVMLHSFTDNQISEYSQEDETYPGQLRFATAIANFGSGPLTVLGKNEWFCDSIPVANANVDCMNGSPPRQVNYQRIYSKKAGSDTLIYRARKAGTNYYDSKPGHDHYHVDDWVVFRLFSVDKEGKKKRQLTEGAKVSFCLFDFGICYRNNSMCEFRGKQYSKENLPNYGFGNFNGCDSGVQGISVGGYDNYGEYYEGQYLTIPPGTPNGNYLLEIEVDPLNIYKESNENNNTLSYPVTLTKQK